ncbi:sensor histidine kinase [Promicromonospora iranensis]|uniref:histidine kinase n=1 Tax=Promicromonospora iranensis TaxID=1105144 RepID=A0ABU2CPV5_9MICO|nr:HAMP domain-containing sensor histidine kinase [Promicromonospora iranensis]MDR7383380.1 signal transduction histidine kinase [Promicromonospora iranensis]
MNDLEGVALSVAVAAVVGAVGAVALFALARRRVALAATLAPLVVVGSVAAGVYASARAMFLSDADSTTVLLLLLATVPVALAVGLVLTARIRRVTTEAAAEKAAAERDREVEVRRREMVAWVSHDLRTPLAAVRALAEALEDGVGPVDEHVPRILAENRRMAAMVDDLLALSRLQSPTATLRREPVAVGDLASDAIASAQPLADAGGVTLTWDVTDPVVTSLDAQQVGRAMENLLVNAIRHTRPGGTVRVAVACLQDAAVGAAPGTVVITVEDECGGIPEGDLDRVFEAGWRSSGARTPERGDAPGGGAGLGLSIVRGVAEAHGGTASVSNVPGPGGGGCRFTLRLPA